MRDDRYQAEPETARVARPDTRMQWRQYRPAVVDSVHHFATPDPGWSP